MKFKKLVEKCSDQGFACKKCEYFLTCQALQRNGIPRPYQYKGHEDNSILNKEIEELEKPSYK